MTYSNEITPRDIFAAHKRIQGIIYKTPLIPSPLLSEKCGNPIYLKLENLQPTGAFKLRGASNKLLSLDGKQRRRGVVTVSSGNHGRAVAYVARQLGIPAVVFLSEKTPQVKIEAIRKLKAEVRIAGSSYDEAEQTAIMLQEARQMVMVDSFDDPLVIAGQGTIGLEIFSELPETEQVVIPLGGGGLAGGISLFAKSCSQAVHTVGVSMDRAPVMYHSLQAGHPITMPEEPTLADGLKGGIGANNRYTFPLCQRLLDDAVLVTETEIAQAMAFMLTEHHQVIEGSGAVGVAALMSGRIHPTGPTVVVISGGIVDIQLLMKVVNDPSGFL